MSVDSMTETERQEYEWALTQKHQSVAARSARTLAQFIERATERPVDMLLFCPRCNAQHVDAPQPEKNWTNPPHRSHECQKCGFVWRPADVPTNGVAAIQTKGQRDSDPRAMW